MAIQKYKGHLALLGAAFRERNFRTFTSNFSNDGRSSLFLDCIYFRTQRTSKAS